MKAAHFSSQELAKVLSHYDIGVIQQTRPIVAGNARAPKMMLASDLGHFLLKRRPHGKDDPRRIAFAHDVQKFLKKMLFPVAAIIPTKDEQSTILCLDKHIYELFEFITGSRFNGSESQTQDAGLQFARFHIELAAFTPHYKPLESNYHNSTIVLSQFDQAHALMKPKPTQDADRLIMKLRDIYTNCGLRIEKLGFAKYHCRTIHGDWHPGNMLFDEDKIVAVVDFDSLKIAPLEIDLANALLQFSLVGGRPNPADWPAYLDHDKISQFLTGCRKTTLASRYQPNTICDLMIEALLSEAIAPVAQTGNFGNVGGFEFLKMIYNKARWIEKHRTELEKMIA